MPLYKDIEDGLIAEHEQKSFDWQPIIDRLKTEKIENVDHAANIIRWTAFVGKSDASKVMALTILQSVGDEFREIFLRRLGAAESAIGETRDEWNLLHGAVKNYNGEDAAKFIRLLVEKGANPALTIPGKMYTHWDSAIEYAVKQEKFEHIKLMIQAMVDQGRDNWVDAFKQLHRMVSKGILSVENYLDIVDATLSSQPMWYATVQVMGYEAFGKKLNQTQGDAFLKDLFEKTGLFGLHAYLFIKHVNGYERSTKFQNKLTDFRRLVRIAKEDGGRGTKVPEELINWQLSGWFSAEYVTLRKAYQEHGQTKGVSEYAAYFNSKRADGSFIDKVVTLMKAKGCKIDIQTTATPSKPMDGSAAQITDESDVGGPSSAPAVEKTAIVAAPRVRGANVDKLLSKFEPEGNKRKAVAPK